ncbi:MAG: sigma-54 dependent transcriptional regulator [Xanthomonadales bacterium]|nr:sigma-54 dependent transcriptional regulator [Xanthomonadales bacterium]
MSTSPPEKRTRRSSRPIGQSIEWRKVIGLAKKMAPLKIPVLITGHSGVGKEVIAQALHHWSDRDEASFIPVNCSLLQEQLFESELFGHKRGAYTGAVSDSDGLFRAASEGTLFLDEIGELSASCQAELLRVLETGKYRPPGSTRFRQTHARIIAATHRDLGAMISQGRFRQDLYYRLNVLTIDIPPLSQRREDIPPLVEYFLSHCSDGSSPALFPGAMEQLKAYHWPGNVRELKNVVERLRVHCDGAITADHVESILARAPGQADQAPLASFHAPGSLAKLEKDYTEWVLAQCAGNVSQAASVLKVSRTTIYRILKPAPS